MAHITCDKELKQTTIRWGEDSQFNVIIEEGAELIKELIHKRRGRTENYDKIAEELADLLICLRQLELHIGEDVVQAWVDLKIDKFLLKFSSNDINAGN